MPKFFKTVALLLLALWLPATLHCGLEAAGFDVECRETPVAADSDGCHEDACDIVEGGSYTKNIVTLRIFPPAVMADTGRVLVLALEPADKVVPAVQTDEPPRVLVLQRSWSFVRRTALPARAPDRLV